MIILYIIAGIAGLILLLNFSLFLYQYFKYPLLRKKEPGFKYVYVENDGRVREVSKEDEDYLTQKFEGADGNRPYIKMSYHQKTPDGKLSGFINRRRVPKDIEIRENRTA
jgi:hypothetical protein